MRTHKALLVRTGIFAVAATLAACGGGSSPISSTGANTATSSAADAAVNPNDPPAVPGAHSSAPVGAPQCPTAQQCQTIGGFTPTFVEPVIYDRSGQGDQQGNSLPITNPLRTVPQDGRCTYDANGRPIACKPAGNSVAMLKDGRILFFNALEGTENVEFSIVTEAGQTIINDQTRVLSFSPDQQTATWTLPGPVDGGAAGQATPLLPGGALNTSGADPRANSGALFCADLKQLSDGRIIAVGGTNYYFEPGISNPFPIGVAELEGLKSSRIFDPATNTWVQAADMNYGRWYPSLTTLPDGDLFVASGVTKLLKPVYPNSPFDSGRNVTQTETYSLGCNTWTDNGGTAERSLPLFPRDHLLPNGQVYYNGGGQAFNPFGQAYDQALWNIVGAYDSVNKTWTDLGYAGLPLQLNQAGIGQITTALNPTNPLAAAALQATLQGAAGTLVNNPSALLAPVMSLLNLNPANAQDTLNQAIGAGFRGSTFSMMMPLKPDPKTGQYDHVEFLTAGGVFGAVTATRPGSYIATALSRIDTIDLDAGGGMHYSSRITGPLTQARWYGTAVMLPTESVMVFSGANRDEVTLPGTAQPILQSEIFDPVTETWSAMATQNHARTYHNTAMLMPDGRVLVGGHAPINTAYLFSIDLPGFSPNFGRDPSFEIYNPPYMFGPRPVITSAPAQLDHGQSFSIQTPQAGSIASVVLIRNTALTHLIDGDQRAVQLNFTQSGNTLSMTLPSNASVVTPGPYMLFINQKTANGLLPSVSAPVLVTGAHTSCP